MKTHSTVALSILAGAAVGAAAVQTLHAQAKPPAYVVAEIEVTDPVGYKAYIDGVGPLIESMGGKFLARGGRVEPIAGVPPKSRVAIYTFPSMEKMLEWRNSAKYKELAATRDKSSNFRSFAAEGLPN